MYVLVSRVGNNFGILDTSDGVLDWLDEKTVKHLVQSGVLIEGIKNGVIKPEPFEINYKLCNWVNNSNIFVNGSRFSYNSKNEFKFKVGTKIFKGKIIDQNNTCLKLKFTNGVVTSVPIPVVRRMME